MKAIVPAFWVGMILINIALDLGAGPDGHNLAGDIHLDRTLIVDVIGCANDV
jgi:hypothetical protein